MVSAEVALVSAGMLPEVAALDSKTGLAIARRSPCRRERQARLQRPLRHRLATAVGQIWRYCRQQLQHLHPRRQEAVGAEGQAAVLPDQGPEAGAHERRWLSRQRLARRQALVAGWTAARSWPRLPTCVATRGRCSAIARQTTTLCRRRSLLSSSARGRVIFGYDAYNRVQWLHRR